MNSHPQALYIFITMPCHTSPGPDCVCRREPMLWTLKDGALFLGTQCFLSLVPNDFFLWQHFTVIFLFHLKVFLLHLFPSSASLHVQAEPVAHACLVAAFTALFLFLVSRILELCKLFRVSFPFCLLDMFFFQYHVPFIILDMFE